MSGSKRCRRCLLREMTGENRYYESVKFYRETMPERLRTPDGLYEERLLACKACRSLESGTCMECGCYVEMRAARSDMHCPAAEAKW